MNKLIKEVSKKDLNLEFLKSLNGLMDLTSRELEVLAATIDISIANEKNKEDRDSIDSTRNRKSIMASTGITRENLSRYIKTYKSKGIIVYQGGVNVINKAIIPIVIGSRSVQITLILKIKDDKI
jgi:hypothetical protein